MITCIPFDSLGRMQNAWLEARYHFSFASYHNPARMGFGNLRVLNDDHIRAGQGFGMHPHHDMEIITYVKTGSIHHRDSLGNHGVTHAGEVQVMSAGTGIVHAEVSDPAEDTRLFQIWIEPREQGVAPRWESASFPEQARADALPLLVSGRAEDASKGALLIHADAEIYGGKLLPGAALTHAVPGRAYAVLSYGQVQLGGVTLHAGDGAEIVSEPTLRIAALEPSELLLIALP